MIDPNHTDRIIAQGHATARAIVETAPGWVAEEILERLLALNLERAAG